jgi:hypothetical protein
MAMPSREQKVACRVFHLNLLVIAAILVGCATVDMVPIPVADTTSPTITLDVFGIPLQQGASSQPNPETIDTSCCAVSRHLRSRQTDVSLLATGIDADGGVQNVRIVIDPSLVFTWTSTAVLRTIRELRFNFA